MSFKYNKKDARCMWCNRTENPHPDFNETIPTKVFISTKKREVELCLHCYEEEVKLKVNLTVDGKRIFRRALSMIVLKSCNNDI